MATFASYFSGNSNNPVSAHKVQGSSVKYGTDIVEDYATNADNFKKAAGIKSKFLRRHLNVRGAKALGGKAGSKYLDILSDLKKTVGGFGLVAELAGTAYGTHFRLKRGESLAPALGKELVENAIYGLAPELLIGTIGKAAVEAYPQLNMMAEQKKAMQNNYNILGGNYLDTQTNLQSRARAMQHIKRSRASIANGLGGEARRLHR